MSSEYSENEVIQKGIGESTPRITTTARPPIKAPNENFTGGE